MAGDGLFPLAVAAVAVVLVVLEALGVLEVIPAVVGKELLLLALH